MNLDSCGEAIDYVYCRFQRWVGGCFFRTISWQIPESAWLQNSILSGLGQVYNDLQKSAGASLFPEG